MRVTRAYRFSASHRLHSPHLSEEENKSVYGKCNYPFGHGHDYTVFVTVSGPVDRASGRVISPGVLDRYVRTTVIAIFDHRDMNTDVRDFEGVPTTENLARDIEKRLRKSWAESFSEIRLERIRIEETPRNTFELRIR